MLRHSKLIAAMIAALALLAVTMPEQADAQSNAAATAASACSHKTALSYRSLGSVHGMSIDKLCLDVHKSLATVSFFDHHRILIAPRFKVWWQVPDSKWRQTVRKARAVLRHHQQVLEEDEVRLQRLSFSIGLEQSILCIHRYEGSWDANTGNGYYGGLQMDWGFMSAYGQEFLDRYGTADRWPPWAQIIAAERAYASGRGFGPWPNTALACGLSTAPVSPSPELVPSPQTPSAL